MSVLAEPTGAAVHPLHMQLHPQLQLLHAPPPPRLPDVIGDLERRMGAVHAVAAADIAAGRMPPPLPFVPSSSYGALMPIPTMPLPSASPPPYPPFDPYGAAGPDPAAAAYGYGPAAAAAHGVTAPQLSRSQRPASASSAYRPQQQPLPAAQQPVSAADLDGLTERWKRIVDVLDAERRAPPPMRAGGSTAAAAKDPFVDLQPKGKPKAAKPPRPASARPASGFEPKPKPSAAASAGANAAGTAPEPQPTTTRATAKVVAEPIGEREAAAARHKWGYGGGMTNSIAQRQTVGDPHNAKLARVAAAKPQPDPYRHGPAFTAAGAGATPPTTDDIKTADDPAKAAAAAAAAGVGQSGDDPLLLSPSQQRAVQHRARVLHERARLMPAREPDVRAHAHVHAGAHARKLSTNSLNGAGAAGEQSSTGDWLRVREAELKDMQKRRDAQVKREQRAEFLAMRDAARNAKRAKAAAMRRTSPDPPYPRVADAPPPKPPLEPLPDPSNAPMHNALLRFDPPHRSELKPEIDPYVAPPNAKPSHGQGAGSGAAPKPKAKKKTTANGSGKPPSTKLKHNANLLPAKARPRHQKKPTVAGSGAAGIAKPKPKAAGQQQQQKQHPPFPLAGEEPPVHVIPTPTFATPTKAGGGLGRRARSSSRSPSPTRATLQPQVQQYDDDAQQQSSAVEDELEQFVAQLERSNTARSKPQAFSAGDTAAADRAAAAAMAAKAIADAAARDRQQHRALAEQAMKAWQHRQQQQQQPAPLDVPTADDTAPPPKSTTASSSSHARIRFQGANDDDDEDETNAAAERAARVVGNAARLASLPPDYGALLIHGAKTPSSSAAAAAAMLDGGTAAAGAAADEPVLVHPSSSGAAAPQQQHTLSQQLDLFAQQQKQAAAAAPPRPEPPQLLPTSSAERGSSAWFQEMAAYLDGMNDAQRTAADALLRAASSAAEVTAAAAAGAHNNQQPSPQPSPSRTRGGRTRRGGGGGGMASPVPRGSRASRSGGGGKQQQQPSKQDDDPTTTQRGSASSLRASGAPSFRDVLRASYESFAAADTTPIAPPAPQTAQQLVRAAMASYAHSPVAVRLPTHSGVTDALVGAWYADRERYRALHRARNAEALGGGDEQMPGTALTADDAASDTLDLPRLNTLLSDKLLGELVAHNTAEIAAIYDQYVEALLRSELELAPVAGMP